jgi:hypothetical protein
MVTLADRLQELADDVELEKGTDPTTSIGEQVGDIIHTPTPEEPLPVALAERTGMGWSTLYNTLTHEAIQVPNSIKDATLKKVHKDKKHPNLLGKPMFSKYPKGTYLLGTHKCMLHPSNPRRAEFDRMGLPICTAEHLPSEDQAEQHLIHRHPSAWNTLERIRERSEREADRELQRQQIAALTAMAGTSPARKSPPKQASGVTIEMPCEEPDCGYVAVSGAPIGARSRLRGHMKADHGKE